MVALSSLVDAAAVEVSVGKAKEEWFCFLIAISFVTPTARKRAGVM